VSPTSEIPAPAPAESAGESSASFLRNSLVFGAVAFGAYLLTLLKTVVVTHYFGTSAEMDAFAVAVLVPNLLGTLVAGSASAGLVPALAVAERHSAQRRVDTCRTFFLLLVGASVAIAVVLATVARPLVHVVAPAFTGQRLAVAQQLAPGASLLFLFTAIYACASAELLSRKKYALVAGAPAVSTALSLVGVLVFHSRGVAVLVWALVGGMAVQALVVSVPAWRASTGGRCTHWRDSNLRRALSAQLILLAASSLGMVNSFVDQVIATLLPTGNVSALSYASSLNNVGMQVIVMSLGWTVLPNLSQLAAAQDLSKLRQKVRAYVLTAVMLAAPACLLILGLGHTAIRVLFEHGRFHADSTNLVYRAWAGYSLGLVPVSIGMMAARVANALEESWLLFRIGMVTLAVNVILDYALMRVAGVMGITLSTSMVLCTASILAYRGLRPRAGELLDRKTARRIISVVGAALAAVIPAVGIRLVAGPGTLSAGLQAFAYLLVLLFAYQRTGIVVWQAPQRVNFRAWQWVRLSVEDSL
jgi:putative peptidoglycan lipid II flippase